VNQSTTAVNLLRVSGYAIIALTHAESKKITINGISKFEELAPVVRVFSARKRA
jgi:hypothetical protein